MANVLLIQPAFVTDIITNSSSEIFVCNTDKTLDAVKEVLASLLDTIGGGPFPEVFGDVGYAKDLPDVVDTYIEYKSGWWRNPHKWGTPESDKWKQQRIAQTRAELPDNFDNFILIESAWDNSIPSELFDIIQAMFNAERWHIG